MIKLSSLNEVLDASQQQQLQESSLAQKAAESAATPQEYKLSPEAQNIVDEVQAGRERDTIRRRLAIYQDAMMQDTVNRFASGGGIHIDPSKRGTFTAAASRHGMGVQEFASHVHAHPENYSPAMRRKANFARNAAKWHHAFGGPIDYANGGYIEDGLRRLGVTGFRVTSGYRGPNSKVGHAGKRSGHARTLEDGSSGAIDIVPTSKTAAGWANLEAQLRSPAVQKFLAGFGGTILDERDAATMRKTGATGPHFHVGLGVRGGGNFYGHNHNHTVPMQDATGMGGYFAMPQTNGQLAVFGNEPAQDTFTPWWQQDGQQDENFLAQQAAGAAGGAYDISQFQPSWIEPVQNSGTFPQLFAHGGFVGPMPEEGFVYREVPQDLMSTLGYRWVSDPSEINLDNSPNYLKEFVDNGLSHGRVLVNSNGQLVTRSLLDNDLTSYNYANAFTEAVQSMKDHPVYQNESDKSAIEVAKNRWGDYRKYAYQSIPEGVAPSTYINKLDTILNNSVSPVMYASDKDHLMDSIAFGWGNDPNRIYRNADGRIRPHFYPYGASGYMNGIKVSVPPNSLFIDPTPNKFLMDYNDELAHNFINGNADPLFKDKLLLHGVRGRPFEPDKESAYNDTRYNEWKAHNMTEPFIDWYLTNTDVNYNQFVNSLHNAASYIKNYPRSYPYTGYYQSFDGQVPILVEPSR